MTELKFKLKKDGKCVGYMWIKDGLILYRKAGGTNWLARCVFEWDSIHPFVCLDRHGKDVYEGDRLREDDPNWGYGGDYDKTHDGYTYMTVPSFPEMVGDVDWDLTFIRTLELIED